MNEQLPPGVYKIVKYGDVYNVVYDAPYLEVPPKIYGKSATYATHFFNTYKFTSESCGVMLIGIKGSGKTELSNMIGNIGINNDMPVVLVSNMIPDINIVNYIDELYNCIIIFDEFGKVFSTEIQDKMLTMFSSSKNKKFFVITDNDTYRISNLLLDRPGRIRYHLDMNRVEEDVVKEYCVDKGVSTKFFKELISIYNTSIIFSFDHLKALVSEHLLNTDTSITDIIKILNVKVLGKRKTIVATSIINKDKIKYKIKYQQKIDKGTFDNGGNYHFQYYKAVGEDEKNKDGPNVGFFNSDNGHIKYNNFYVNSEDIVDIDESAGIITCKKNDFIVTLKIENN